MDYLTSAPAAQAHAVTYLHQGLRVAACKLTGSVSHRDQYALRGTGAHHVRDFSDYGYPSTYLCERDELTALFDAMMADAAAAVPDVTVVEIADGVLQRETMLLLEDDYVKQRIHGVVLTAGCALSALRGVEEIERRGHQVVTVSGLITNAPLFVREFDAHRPDVPVASSTDDGAALAATRDGLGERDREPPAASSIRGVGALAPQPLGRLCLGAVGADDVIMHDVLVRADALANPRGGAPAAPVHVDVPDHTVAEALGPPVVGDAVDVEEMTVGRVGLGEVLEDAEPAEGIRPFAELEFGVDIPFVQHKGEYKCSGEEASAIYPHRPYTRS